MKGLIMHSPASMASMLLRCTIIMMPLLIGSGGLTPTAAEARASHQGKPHAKAVGKKKAVAAGKHAKRGTARRSDPRKLVLPAAEPSRVIDVAAQYLGRPYRFGSSAGAYDCSGFVRRVFEEIGIDLPHSAQGQFFRGDSVHRDELTVGDLVFFRTYRRGASHVGIYVGDDKFIHAATRGGQVQVDSLNQQYYAARYLGARRIETES